MAKKRIDTGDGGSLKSNPFGALAGIREALPEGESEAQVPGSEPTALKPQGAGPRRAIVRYQRKGRGGKEVTLVQQLGLDADGLASWCKALKRSLGCGGHVESEDLVLAGDQRARLPELLSKRGVAKVVVS